MEKTVKECRAEIPVLFDDIRQGCLLHDQLETLISSEADSAKVAVYKSLQTVTMLNICSKLVLTDIITMVLAMPSSQQTNYAYANRFYIKHLRGAIHEGYALLCLKKKKENGSLWAKFKTIVSESGDSSMIAKLNAVDTSLKSFASSADERAFRNLTFHYNSELSAIVEQMNSICDDRPDLQRAISYINTVKNIVEMSDDITIKLMQSNSIQITFPPLSSFTGFDNIHDSVEKALNKDSQMANLMNRIISGVTNNLLSTYTDLSGFKKFVDGYENLPDLSFLGIVKPEIEEKEFAHISFNTYLCVYLMTLDVACVMKAYLVADSHIEKSLILRRIHLCSQAMLDLIMVQNDDVLEPCLWKSLSDEMSQHPELNFDTNVSDALLKKVKEEIIVKKERHLYVHYYTGNRPDIHSFVDSLSSMDPKKELYKGFLIIDVLKKVQDNLLKLLLWKSEKLNTDWKKNMDIIGDKRIQTRESINQMPDSPEKSLLLDMLNKAESILIDNSQVNNG